ncbi:MAG: GNAT family N-acetyltransferase [Shimia thalassica]|uniref:Putative phosphinothricin acetyltransferase YwnH n=2 Tax=Shimia thalassica TaxID=1715693 RepID=A0A0N7MAC0_9RHOB|nr:GNAT family N-acetyltransferase [Shimia thalassica]MDO6484822.1 GNAT family N-acetyltransferase [Shimia thalassica]CUK09766.1 Putative phosphinothricin acetyltransferase YwnH [Shimia thalassica]
MSKLSIRPGASADIRQVADLLNEIIAAGGTTALTEPMTRDALEGWLFDNADRSTWHVAIDDTGEMLGFQWIGIWPELPPEACDIGTFVKTGRSGLGIGSALFEATKQAAIDLGYDWINANIRADNSGGLAYYQSRGFRDWGQLDNIELADGTKVNKTLKRYDLKD